MVMKTKYVLVLMAMMFVISGCREEVTKEVGDTTINIAELNGKREIDKNDKIFANNNQGKHDLLMLMANSVDHYNLISGTMLSTLSYQGQKSESKYIFQVNVPEYQSYIYLVPSKNEESQVTFRDSERMYFFVGDLVSLNNNLDELINKQMMTQTHTHTHTHRHPTRRVVSSQIRSSMRWVLNPPMLQRKRQVSLIHTSILPPSNPMLAPPQAHTLLSRRKLLMAIQCKHGRGCADSKPQPSQTKTMLAYEI